MRKQLAVKRMVMNAAMIAVYVVLSLPFLTIPVGGIKITFEHFPVVLCGVLFGPIEAMIVGGIGEFINQITSFGFTPTTLLWILPIMVRGLIVGLCAKCFKKHMGLKAIVQRKVPVVFFVICIVSGIISSLFNTLALYVDSKLFGYYTFAMVFGALAVRILLSAVTSIVIAVAIKPILHAFRHENFI